MTLVEQERTREIEIMNKILDMLQPMSLEAADRILTWVQSKIELDWDD